MRPIKKWAVGDTNPITNKAILAIYNPHIKAKPDLAANLGDFCSYCEVFDSDSQVEHIVSKNQDNGLSKSWTNFALACGICNNNPNKGSKSVDLDTMYFPHRNNTFLIFTYGEGGFVSVNTELSNQQKQKAQALMSLVGLDKYPKKTNDASVDLKNDKRWQHRHTAWEYAVRYLTKYELRKVSAKAIAHIAEQRGFFSVWFTVFMAHQEVKAALINHFEGTALDCFDDDYNPIPRNPNNASDPI